MKTFLILALLAAVATTTTAQIILKEPQEQPCQQPTQQYPFPQQQLESCREFFLQQCSPAEMAPFLRSSHMLQQSSCQVMHQQCCQQLPKSTQQQQQQHQQQKGQITSRRFGFRPQEEQKCGQGYFLPQQIAQTLPAMCNVYLPPYCTTTAAEPFGTGSN
ncbi:hypothetical protein BRADI_2g33280v3 [Brachypodium distachyon]|uniref:Prolamin n=1 Tax=Brachypodium distachyon TaxID=15368 RepID=A0A2K2DBI8_BRADI|nr:hypothetical protein BRADI_2g33280v3 [Brachypodium distachyon]